MSNENTPAAAAADTETADVTTLNSHATIQPVKIAPLDTEETGGQAKPDNSHATDEKA
ncbi:hypothetical protein GCM10010503_49970 [Streptomyces lucensis JCM 4490]|uniref:Uncharacterized protein n=1 Tax=Streptomyces lucensis JCM 4490 TaxID=1306176 RepID=A0A918JBB2_9ACTN|nr:hypothetical protein [Streptomyces lucensis]GGW66716.1 hypothetical protein GCM10010503_49970 [Streptomyces lucensis JCM 4490]